MKYLKRLLLLLIFISFSLLLNASSLEKNNTALTKEEKEYLNQNKIKVAMIKDYYPFSYQKNNKVNGFSFEYFKLLASKVDMKYDIQIDDWSANLDDFKNKKIDIIDAISYTKQREDFTSFLDAYFEIPNVIFSKKDTIKDYKGLVSLKGKRVGITKDIYYFKAIEDLNLFELVVFENSREKIQALAYGKIDAAFNNLISGQKYAIQGAYSNIEILDELSTPTVKKEDLRLGVRKENPILFSILQKATNSITPTEKLNLIKKYFGCYFEKIYNNKKTISNNTIELTKKEKDFLKKHPKIVLGTADNWAPSSIKNEDGSIIGYDQDILDKINSATGANFVLKLGNWAQMQELAKKRKVDGLATLILTKEREEFFNFTKPYIELTKNAMVKTGNPLNIKSLKDLEGKTIALHKGNISDKKIVNQIKNVKVIELDSVLEVLKEVMYGDADATFGNGATEYIITKKSLPYLTNAFSMNESLKLRLALRNDWPEAISILNKGLSTVSEHEKIAILKKWFGGSKEVGIKFSQEESEYLDAKKEIKMCVDPSFLPYEQINQNGDYIGIGADVIKLISQKIDKTIVLVPTKTWAESLNAIKNKECDIFPMATNTPNRRIYLNFTKPYILDSLVVATKTEQFFIKDSSDLSNRKIGIIFGYSYTELLKEKNPNINIINVKSTEDGLRMVQKGELFGYVDALSIIAYAIQKNGFVDLKVAGSIEFDEQLSVASRNDEPFLNDIIQKALDDIGKEQIRTIVGRWIAIKVEQSFDYKKLLYISLFFLVVLALVIHRNRVINKLNKKLETSYKEIEEKNRLLEKLSITDNLTQLYNRNKLDEVLLSESNRANRSSHTFGIIIIDIDYFKKVNDTHGHIAGDTILKEFTSILKSNSRKIDTVGRWGGEEFLILCPETNLEGILTFAENLRAKISSFPFSHNEQKTASFGVAIYQKGEDISDMIKRADKALYKAKNSGRNRVESI